MVFNVPGTFKEEEVLVLFLFFFFLGSSLQSCLHFKYC